MAQMFANLFGYVLDLTTSQISALLDEFSSNADAELAGFLAVRILSATDPSAWHNWFGTSDQRI